MTDRHRELIKLLNETDAPAQLAIELANDGVVEALPAILQSIVADCGWEIVPQEKIDAYVKLASPNAFPALLRELERLDESKLENDSGDMGDEFWRIQQSIEKILVGIGAPVVDRISAAIEETQNEFALETLKDALAAIAG